MDAKLNTYMSNIIYHHHPDEHTTVLSILAATKGEAMRIAQTIPGGFVYGKSVRKANHMDCYHQRQIEALKQYQKEGVISTFPANESK
jgi:hypothetical protein